MFNISNWKLVLYIVLFLLIIISFWLTMKFTEKKNNENIRIKLDDGVYLPFDKKYGEDPKSVKTLGSKLSCDSLRDVLGQKIKLNHQIMGTKSHISGNPLEVDCFETMSGIGLKYHPKSFYSFEGESYDNKDVYEFYDRLSLNEILKEQMDMTNNKYLEIPYTADMCENRNGNLVCDERVPVPVRRERLNNYISNKIGNLFV